MLAVRVHAYGEKPTVEEVAEAIDDLDGGRLQGRGILVPGQ